jgi:hypothetical protein
MLINRVHLLLMLTCVSIASATIQPQANELCDTEVQISQAIERTEPGRYFIKPEKLVFSEGHLFVESDHRELIGFSMICVTEGGTFIPTSSRPYQPSIIWICRNCTHPHSYQPTICEVCNCRDFIVRYR